jgi:hypothetical protein
LRGWRRKAWGFKSPLPHHHNQFTRTGAGVSGHAPSSGRSVKIEHADYTDYHYPHHCLLLHHHRRVTAERQKRRHCGGLWRHGQPDRIWTTRSSQRLIEGDYLVGGDVHGDLHHAIDFRFASHGIEVSFARDSESNQVRANHTGHASAAGPNAEIVTRG